MSAHGGKELCIGRNGGGKELCIGRSGGGKEPSIAFNALSDGGTELCLALSGDPPRRPAPTLALALAFFEIG